MRNTFTWWKGTTSCSKESKLKGLYITHSVTLSCSCLRHYFCLLDGFVLIQLKLLVKNTWQLLWCKWNFCTTLDTSIHLLMWQPSEMGFHQLTSTWSMMNDSSEKTVFTSLLIPRKQNSSTNQSWIVAGTIR